MRLGRHPEEAAPESSQDGPGRTEAAPTVFFSGQAAKARQRAAQRRSEAEALEQRALELEQLAVVEARRQAQVTEAERLEQEARGLDAGPIPETMAALKEAQGRLRKAEARIAKLFRWTENRQQALRRAVSLHGELLADGLPGDIASAARRAQQLEGELAELGAAQQVAESERRQAEADVERLARQVEELEWQRDQLSARASFLRRCDGEPEEIQRARDRDQAHRQLVEANPRMAVLATALGVPIEAVLRP